MWSSIKYKYEASLTYMPHSVDATLGPLTNFTLNDVLAYLRLLIQAQAVVLIFLLNASVMALIIRVENRQLA